MFVETAGILSDQSETQVEEAEAPDVENASGRCFPEISLVNFGAKMLDRRRCDEGQSTTHSTLTVFENNAYEDTIPSLVGRKMTIYNRAETKEFNLNINMTLRIVLTLIWD